MSITLRATLLSAALLDELTTGFLTIALPVLRDHYHLSYEQIGLLFTAGALSALVIEPPLNLLSDRGSKRLLILVGAVVLALAFVLAGAATNFALLALAFAVIWPADGAAVGISQAALVDAAPGETTGTMTRWTLLSGVGDLLSPLAVSALLALAFGWLALCVVAAALWFIFAALIAGHSLPKPSHPAGEAEDANDPSLRESLRAALRNPTLLRWMVVVLLADMMDEVFLAFAALYLRDRLHFSPSLTGLAIGIGLAGGLVALVILDRVAANLSTHAVLPWLAVLTCAGVALVIFAPAPWAAIAGLVAANAGAAGWYPLAKAQAYGALPGRTGTIRALLGLGEPYNVVLPAFTGFVAAHWGLGAALAFLGVSSVGVFLVAPRRARASIASHVAAG